MFIYNITNKVDHSILKEWITWQKEEHIPEIMSTNLFNECKFYHLLEHNDMEGATYIIQYYTTERKNYDKYINDYAPKLREKALKKWGNAFIAFRSILESVQ